jgi:F-type H+-transporting ATPase subunit b
MDPPHHVNWWRGLVGVDNEKAQEGGFLNHLLWRYNNPNDPCDAKNEPPPFLANILNVGLLAYILYRAGRKPLAQALVKRKQAIMEEFDKAAKLLADAEKRLKFYQDKLEHLEEELVALKADHAAQAELERKNLLAELEDRRARMRRDAEFRVEQELKAARVELLEEAVRGAVSAAEEMIRREVSGADFERLAEEYLRSIPVAFGASSLGARAAGTQSTGATP